MGFSGSAGLLPVVVEGACGMDSIFVINSLKILLGDHVFGDAIDGRWAEAVEIGSKVFARPNGRVGMMYESNRVCNIWSKGFVGQVCQLKTWMCKINRVTRKACLCFDT